MAREDRKRLIEQIEALRKSKLITYMLGDRRNLSASINEDAVRAMYDHVIRIGHTGKLDLFLYSIGGSVEVPWKIVCMLREYCDELGVLIPYRAYSAATLLAMGCDHIFLGKKGELGPIDPALNVGGPTPGGIGVVNEVRVEDIMSYVDFLKTKAGLTEQGALGENIRLLGEKLTPATLGSIYRTHSHIRMLAGKLLHSRRETIPEDKVEAIVKMMAEKIYSHGHAIGRKEAEEIGLPLGAMSPELDAAMGGLLVEYELLLNLRKPFDPEAELQPGADEGTMAATVAIIESMSAVSAHRGTVKFTRLRQTTGPVAVNLNLGVQLPQNLPAQAIPQQAIQQILQQVQNDVPRMVQEQVKAQSPTMGHQVQTIGFNWEDATAETN
jgi:hypothetical protein